VLKSGRTSWLAGRLSDRTADFAPEDLSALGLQLLEELDASSLAGRDALEDESDASAIPEDASTEDALEEDADYVPEPADGDSWLGELISRHLSDHEKAAAEESLPGRDDAPAHDTPSRPEFVQRAHCPHPVFGEKVASASAAQSQDPPPSVLLDPNDPEVLAKLEHLDDLVYEAIGGKAAAMRELQQYWPLVRQQLGNELLVESQEQYLRYALSTWTESIESDALREPAQAVHSLEVLCVLFNER
jgi:hypothetical protein